jgi:hypothetical protein
MRVALRARTSGSRGEQVGVRLTAASLRALDDWIAQRGLPLSRADALRTLAFKALPGKVAPEFRRMIQLTNTDGSMMIINRVNVALARSVHDLTVVIFKDGSPVAVMETLNTFQALWRIESNFDDA